MDPPKPSNLSSSQHTPRDSQTPQNPRSPPAPKPRDFLTHLESYLAKRDGVDKLLKISRYAAKIILASSLLPSSQPLHPRLKAFESSVGLSRKAFRLGKFVQDLNALRNYPRFDSRLELVLSIVAYGGEGVYYFAEQFVWLMKSGLIGGTQLRNLQMISAWAELIGYFGSVALKVRDLKRIDEEEACLRSSVEIAKLRGEGCGLVEVEKKIGKLREKRLMKRLSVVQDLADGLMALGDVRDGKGRFTGPVLMSSAGLLSAVISTHKNWVSC